MLHAVLTSLNHYCLWSLWWAFYSLWSVDLTNFEILSTYMSESLNSELTFKFLANSLNAVLWHIGLRQFSRDIWTYDSSANNIYARVKQYVQHQRYFCKKTFCKEKCVKFLWPNRPCPNHRWPKCRCWIAVKRVLKTKCDWIVVG